MKKIMLGSGQALDLFVIDGSCLQNETEKNDFVLVFEGHQKRIVGLRMSRDTLSKLKDNIDLYFKSNQ